MVIVYLKTVLKLSPVDFRDITEDEACVDELRMTFRFFASVLVRRAQKVTFKPPSAESEQFEEETNFTQEVV